MKPCADCAAAAAWRVFAPPPDFALFVVCARCIRRYRSEAITPGRSHTWRREAMRR